MQDSFVYELLAERIGGVGYGKGGGIYKFEKIRRARVAAEGKYPGVKVLDMGIGEPDGMADARVVEALGREAGRMENRVYADNGGVEFKREAAAYMKRVYGVELDEEREVMHSMGIKGALVLLAKVFINPGDVVLMTTPGYLVFGTQARYLGGEVYGVPLVEERGYLPDLKGIPEGILKRAKVLVLNYPNNPTGAVATREFFEEVVAWAKEHSVFIIHDAAYTELMYEGGGLSILEVAGAKEVAVELHSLSKGWNMTGWRIGWVCGNELVVSAYGAVKIVSDCGQFLGIQKAAGYALGLGEVPRENARKYRRRMEGLVEVLKEVGFKAEVPRGGFFLYVRAPRRVVIKGTGEERRFGGAEDFSEWLVGTELISTVPWDEAGAYVRFAVTFQAEAGEGVFFEELRGRLGKYVFYWE